MLILDNCEHLREECAALVAGIHETNERWHILATSRRSLDLGGEVIRRVAPLDLPGPDETTPDTIGASAAVRLLLDRAGESVVLNARNAATIAALCRRLDGLPLALELAAARLRVFDPATILQNIEEHFDLLGPAGVDRPPRHQTMQTVIAWSHKLLAPEEQCLFRRLAIFEQGFTLAAAEAVCADPEEEAPAPAPHLPRRAIAATLVNLVDQSLVVVARTPQGNRFHLLETIRAFAHQQTEEHGESGSLGARHARWYTTRAERNPYPFDSGAAMREWLDELTIEQANIRTALHWAQEHDPELGLRLVGVLWSYWFLRGSHASARAWLRVFIDAAPPDSPHLAAALHGLGYLSIFNHVPSMQTSFIRAVAIAELHNDHDRIAAAAPFAAFALSVTGALEEAKGYLDRSWLVIRNDETNQRKNFYQVIRGYIALADGKLETGRRLLERSARATKVDDQPIYHCLALIRLGAIYLQQGKAGRAIETFEELIATAVGIGSWFYHYVGRNRLALSYEWQGDLNAAAAGIAEGLKISGAEGGSRFEQGIAQLAYGRQALYRGDPMTAVVHLDAAAAIVEHLAHTVIHSELDYLFGLALWDSDRPLAARHLLATLNTQQQQRANIITRMEGLAWLAATDGYHAKAARWLDAAEVLRAREGIARPHIEYSRHEATLAAIAASVGNDAPPNGWPETADSDPALVVQEEARTWLARYR